MIEYVIDEANHLIRVWMTGSNQCEDLKAHYARVLRDPRYESTLDSIFQIDGNSDGPIMMELPEVKTVMEMVAQCQAATKWAVVLPAGFKRTVVEYLLQGVNLQSVTMRFFGTEDEAIAWLNEGREFPVAAFHNEVAQPIAPKSADECRRSPAGSR
jgi:hypothetical protein